MGVADNVMTDICTGVLLALPVRAAILQVSQFESSPAASRLSQVRAADFSSRLEPDD
jgi:hypothetical protein